jgi:hypothetical protein
MHLSSLFSAEKGALIAAIGTRLAAQVRSHFSDFVLTAETFFSTVCVLVCAIPIPIAEIVIGARTVANNPGCSDSTAPVSLGVR